MAIVDNALIESQRSEREGISLGKRYIAQTAVEEVPIRYIEGWRKQNGKLPLTIGRMRHVVEVRSWRQDQPCEQKSLSKSVSWKYYLPSNKARAESKNEKKRAPGGTVTLLRRHEIAHRCYN